MIVVAEEADWTADRVVTYIPEPQCSVNDLSVLLHCQLHNFLDLRFVLSNLPELVRR